MGATGLEPVTPSLSSKGLCNASAENKGLTTSEDSRCTSGCTSEPESSNVALDALAAAVSALSPEDRVRLVALLLNHSGKPDGSL